ncbi:helix-turn-helix transcriptional regulator [Streptomyces avermitilis]
MPTPARRGAPPAPAEPAGGAASLSPSRLAHPFAEPLGRSPMRALRDARLPHAARLLEATELSVERVAAASGFADPFHFGRAFRQRYGSPLGRLSDRPRTQRSLNSGQKGDGTLPEFPP